MKKILTLLIPLFLVLVSTPSCDYDAVFTTKTKSELDQQLARNAHLEDSIAALKSQFNKQNEALVGILSEIASVSNRTARISIGSESPMSEIALAEQDLESIRARISELEKEAEKTRRLSGKLAVAQNTISELRQTVSILEERVDGLRSELEKSKATIAAQGRTITGQRDSINKQLRDISRQKSENTQLRNDYAQLFYDAGKKISTIADEGDFKITGRRNRESVANYRRSMYEDALQFYLEAASKRLPGAVDSVISMRVKITALGGKP